MFQYCIVLTFDVVFEDGSVVVLPPGHLEACAGVGLSALVPGYHLNLAPVSVLTLGDVKMPHSIIDQLVSASLNLDILNYNSHKFNFIYLH